MKIDIICIARAKKGSHIELIKDYQKRIQWPLNIIECESKEQNPDKKQHDECEKLKKHIEDGAILIAMDERGKSLSSRKFAKKIQTFQDDGITKAQFIIGGADGLTSELRQKATFLMAFGEQTWPHLLARIMLLEQIYRSQQILAGHPYHRD